ncbi:MAG: hypothetical protein KatS3mg028_0507 [Bacteroidia bacterium]|nr:MAG: hypothetical protein KatS3mg028_0507 [Bacteroidia bacterium]
MKKKVIYTAVFAIVALILLMWMVHRLNRQTVVENKILSHLPPQPVTILIFETPAKLYNKYLTNNLLFKKIQFPEKENLMVICKHIDSMYQIASHLGIHFQNQSFVFARYSNNQWLMAFAVSQFKDIPLAKNFLDHTSFRYIEKDGNFFISDKQEFLQDIMLYSHKDFWYESLKNLSKLSFPLYVYQKTDTAELSYHVHFKANEINFGGFIRYKNKKNYANYPKSNTDFHSLDNVRIQDFTLYSNEDSVSSPAVESFMSSLKNHYQRKKIELPQITIIPVSNPESINDILPQLSDSALSVNNLMLYFIKKKYVPYFKFLLTPKMSDKNIVSNFSDSILYIACTEYNVSFVSSLDEIIRHKDLMMQDLSQSSYYLIFQKDVSAQELNNHHYHFIPFSFVLTSRADTNSYTCYTDIFSSGSTNYFSFISQIQQNPLNNQYLWAYSHDVPIEKIAGFFDDHKTNTYFIILQDSLNRLICLNGNAEKLWTYMLDSPVQSDIFNVDILKNNKHQMLFNTSNALYLLDRNGKNVGRFPLRFVSHITNPVSVLDYDNKKNYRLWFSTKNRYTYNYTLDGKLADQFRPYYFQYLITLPPAYVSIGASDYVLLIADNGSIVAVGRKGDGRFLLKNKLPSDTRHYFLDAANTLSNSYLYYCTSKEFCRISLSDELKCLKKFNEEIVAARFLDKPFSPPLLLTLTNERVSIYDLKGELQQSFKTDKAYTKVHVQYMPSVVYLILSNEQQHTIFKYDTEKNIRCVMKSIQSSVTPHICSLFKDNQMYVIYTQKNRLCIRKVI